MNGFDPRFVRRVERLHDLGPRPLGEILSELVERWGREFGHDLDARLDRYGQLSPDTIRDLGADRFPPSPMRLIRGGRDG